MAALSSEDRQALWADLMEDLSNTGQSVGIIKAALRDAVNAADAWVDDNASNFNSALPQPARGTLTASQKAQILMFVMRRRWELT